MTATGEASTMFEVQTDNNRFMIAKVVFALIGVGAIVIGEIRNVTAGWAPRPSFITVVIMTFGITGMLRFRTTALRIVFAMAAFQAMVRIALWLTNASTDSQRVAALGGNVVILIAALIALVPIVKWLISAARGQPSSDREQPAS
jgi:hypothetical protein